MREVVDVLERARRGAAQSIRARLPAAGRRRRREAPLALSLRELLAAVDRVLRVAREPPMHDVIPRALDVPARSTSSARVLALRAQRAVDATSWRADAEPWQVLSTLLALLELAQARRAAASLQPRPFANVEITRDAASEAA